MEEKPIMKRRSLPEQIENEQPSQEERKTSWEVVLSTGSTLLDLAISGTRIKGGGIPGGILVEVYGPSGAGKTAILSEVLASAQARGGKILFNDPEGRLDREYSQIYGMDIDEENYKRPDTVIQAFNFINQFVSDNHRDPGDPINVVGTDSLAALSTEMEMTESRDKMGMKRAKDFSQETRRSARLISNSGNLVICSNQVREGQMSQEVTPGGKAIPFYSSLRIRVGSVKKMEREIKLESKKAIKKVLGIMSSCSITKSSLDDPYRSAPIFIRFGYGIDDIQGNLWWLKDIKKDSMFQAPDGKKFMGLDQACSYVDKEDELVRLLREEVIKTWEEIESRFQVDRRPKRRS